MLSSKKIIKKLLDINYYKCLYWRKKLNFLQKIYKFDKWHANAPFFCRPYKKILVNEINSLEIKDCAIEIGGGLGDIISRLKVNKKYLIDLDKKLKDVINKLHKDIIFQDGSFDKITQIKENNIDVLILVNWIHNIEKEFLISELKNILINKNIKYIVLDEIDKNVKGYKYKHDFENSLEGFVTHKIIQEPEGIRKFRILKSQNFIIKAEKIM